jgi:hypothetical protein
MLRGNIHAQINESSRMMGDRLVDTTDGRQHTFTNACQRDRSNDHDSSLYRLASQRTPAAPGAAAVAPGSDNVHVHGCGGRRRVGDHPWPGLVSPNCLPQRGQSGTACSGTLWPPGSARTATDPPREPDTATARTCAARLQLRRRPASCPPGQRTARWSSQRHAAGPDSAETRPRAQATAAGRSGPAIPARILPSPTPTCRRASSWPAQT